MSYGTDPQLTIRIVFNFVLFNFPDEGENHHNYGK